MNNQSQPSFTQLCIHSHVLPLYFLLMHAYTELCLFSHTPRFGQGLILQVIDLGFQ
jgi:hypothetical protein